MTEVESTLEGDMDVRGALGLSDDYRNGFERIRVTFRVAGDAPAEKLRELVQRAQQRSAVFDMVTNGVPVTVELDACIGAEVAAHGAATDTCVSPPTRPPSSPMR